MRTVLSLIILAVAAPLTLAQDPVSVDASHYKVLLDNDQVRVLRIHYNPKELSVMHEHPASVVVFLNDSQAVFTLPDGTKLPNAGGKKGEVRFAESGKHQPENTGKTPVEAVLVELKGRPGTSSAVSLDAVKTDPGHHKLEFENDRVRVLRIKLKPGDKSKQHEHPNGVAIFLTDAQAKFGLADGTIREGGGKRGEANWAAAEKHTVENASDKAFEVILVELK
jgi:quercetin dioxygenase-like cupin family protein